jgi:hypothetical protein
VPLSSDAGRVAPAEQCGVSKRVCEVHSKTTSCPILSPGDSPYPQRRVDSSPSAQLCQPSGKRVSNGYCRWSDLPRWGGAVISAAWFRSRDRRL